MQILVHLVVGQVQQFRAQDSQGHRHVEQQVLWMGCGGDKEIGEHTWATN